MHISSNNNILLFTYDDNYDTPQPTNIFLSVRTHLLLSPEPAVILSLLQLAPLLHHLLVLGVENLPLGLHLPQLPGQGLDLLSVIVPESIIVKVFQSIVISSYIHLPEPFIISSSSQLSYSLYSDTRDRETLGVEVARACSGENDEDEDMSASDTAGDDGDMV